VRATVPQAGVSEADQLAIDDDLRRLQLLEVRARLADLQRPWWQKPSTLAPLATIAAALLGLAWGVATGFFDVSRRELEVAKRELIADTADLRDARDKQTATFLVQKRQQDAAIARLRNQAATLTRAVSRLDVPVITEAVFGKAADATDLVIMLDDLTVTGTHFGSVPGSATVAFAYHFRLNDGTERTNSVPMTVMVKTWSDTTIVLRPSSDPNHPLSAAISDAPSGSRARWLDILVTLTRRDLKSSITRPAIFEGAAHLKAVLR
jgi:hypothetical protein